MTRFHSPLQQLKEAKAIAAAYGIFVVEKPGRFLLYRSSQPRNIYLGYRSAIADFRHFVEACAGNKKAAR